MQNNPTTIQEKLIPTSEIEDIEVIRAIEEQIEILEQATDEEKQILKDSILHNDELDPNLKILCIRIIEVLGTYKEIDEWTLSYEDPITIALNKIVEEIKATRGYLTIHETTRPIKTIYIYSAAIQEIIKTTKQKGYKGAVAKISGNPSSKKPAKLKSSQIILTKDEKQIKETKKNHETASKIQEDVKNSILEVLIGEFFGVKIIKRHEEIIEEIEKINKEILEPQGIKIYIRNKCIAILGSKDGPIYVPTNLSKQSITSTTLNIIKIRIKKEAKTHSIYMQLLEEKEKRKKMK